MLILLSLFCSVLTFYMLEYDHSSSGVKCPLTNIKLKLTNKNTKYVSCIYM